MGVGWMDECWINRWVLDGQMIAFDGDDSENNNDGDEQTKFGILIS